METIPYVLIPLQGKGGGGTVTVRHVHLICCLDNVLGFHSIHSKMMALKGTKYALFYLQTLIDALKDYSTKFSSVDPEVKLAEFKSEEDLLFQTFREMPLPELVTNLWEPIEDERARTSFVDHDVLLKGNSICKTARTPAQTRYLGYLTNTDKVGGPASLGNETYDLGLTMKEADATDANGIMRLVQGPHHNCKDAINMPDYKDFFYAHHKDDWVTLTIPNEAERKAYNYDPAVMKGVVVVQHAVCDPKCLKGNLSWGDYKAGKFEIEVNGVRVTEIGDVHDKGIVKVLNHKNGVIFKPDLDGLFNIRFRVTEPGSFFRLSAVVVF